ncbi:MAG: hypothetical protein A4E38_00820 [Methanoregulaceae archaeon PtaB.Bin108]|nr:MAG: hypothetical protein A4E38_00820 [Methanoregulaceae archaeon PtaB.Bin108]
MISHEREYEEARHREYRECPVGQKDAGSVNLVMLHRMSFFQ